MTLIWAEVNKTSGCHEQLHRSASSRMPMNAHVHVRPREKPAAGDMDLSPNAGDQKQVVFPLLSLGHNLKKAPNTTPWLSHAKRPLTIFASKG